jgi:hypothetical protein
MSFVSVLKEKNNSGKPKWYLSFHKNLSFEYLKIDEDRQSSNQKVREMAKFDSEADIKWVNFQRAIP